MLMNKIIKAILIINYSLLIINSAHGQYTKQDTLRGSNGPGRDWWDVTKYDITVKPDFNNKSIEGIVKIDFKVLVEGKSMQIDLQEPMIIDVVNDGIYKGEPNAKNIAPTVYDFRKEGNAYFIDVSKQNFQPGSVHKLVIKFHGNPRVAQRPPWDGGWIFVKDAQGRPWMSVACQGLGASVWYPCKDYQGDEPVLGARLTKNVPDS